MNSLLEKNKSCLKQYYKHFYVTLNVDIINVHLSLHTDSKKFQSNYYYNIHHLSIYNNNLT